MDFFIFMLAKMLCATRFVLLDRGAFHRAVATENTAITLQWLQYGMAVLTLIEVLARVCGHFLFFGVAALWACDSGSGKNLHYFLILVSVTL